MSRSRFSIGSHLSLNSFDFNSFRFIQSHFSYKTILLSYERYFHKNNMAIGFTDLFTPLCSHELSGLSERSRADRVGVGANNKCWPNFHCNAGKEEVKGERCESNGPRQNKRLYARPAMREMRGGQGNTFWINHSCCHLHCRRRVITFLKPCALGNSTERRRSIKFKIQVHGATQPLGLHISGKTETLYWVVHSLICMF